ncbi:MAG: TIGR01440 family protein [Negativicutes bacterium]|jgi:uncharacterized protein (TIGR01440 family)|nr:TIGR01440 family protein [Negativicutes bacterium]
MSKWEIEEASLLAKDLFKMLQLPAGSIVVIGCSTSEIQGRVIGKYGSLEIAETLYNGLMANAKSEGIDLVFQCCEHLNRAIVVDGDLAREKGWNLVSARPVASAGGSMGTTAWEKMKNPVLVERVEVDGGIDIGQTLIGMHLKRVAVPVRLSRRFYGEALITAAKTRLPLIGGSRAQYPET